MEVVEALRNVHPQQLATALDGKQPGGAIHPHIAYYHAAEGEHYRLLAYVAALYDGELLVDIGTHIGLSALALSGGSNRVLSFDIEPQVLRGLPFPDTVHFRTVNIAQDKEAFPLEAAFAVLDIDPHAGNEERTIVQQLLDRGWKGVMICDDIHLNEGMRTFWKWCQACECLRTLDLTSVGHTTGTGLLVFAINRI